MSETRKNKILQQKNNMDEKHTSEYQLRFFLPHKIRQKITNPKFGSGTREISSSEKNLAPGTEKK